jgi:RNA polymerase sigma-70 factor, ECF subfamily
MALSPEVRTGFETARSRWPQLAVSEETFESFLAYIAAPGAPGAPPVAASLIEDLFIACACLNGAPGAAAAFEQHCGPAIRSAAAQVARSAAAQDEVVQEVRELVLVGRAGAAPKLAGYSGQGPLARWVAVIARNQALSAARSDGVRTRVREAAAAEPGVPRDPEIEFLKRRYRGAFEGAVADALGVLADRDRLLLRLNLVDGISLEKIGQMYGVDASTASRWLAKAREAIKDEIHRLLRERLALTPSQLDSLGGLVASQIDLSLSRLLRG